MKILKTRAYSAYLILSLLSLPGFLFISDAAHAQNPTNRTYPIRSPDGEDFYNYGTNDILYYVPNPARVIASLPDQSLTLDYRAYVESVVDDWNRRLRSDDRRIQLIPTSEPAEARIVFNVDEGRTFDSQQNGVDDVVVTTLSSTPISTSAHARTATFVRIAHRMRYTPGELDEITRAFGTDGSQTEGYGPIVRMAISRGVGNALGLGPEILSQGEPRGPGIVAEGDFRLSAPPANGTRQLTQLTVNSTTFDYFTSLWNSWYREPGQLRRQFIGPSQIEVDRILDFASR